MTIARFTLKAGAAFRRVEAMKRFADKLGDQTLTHFKDRGVTILQEEVPDYTGEMKNKCKGEITGHMLKLWPDTPYAHIIDGEGKTAASPGRYVPAIGKRLVKPSKRNPDIGTHPGAKKTPFSQRTLDRLADEAEDWLRQKAREMVT